MYIMYITYSIDSVCTSLKINCFMTYVLINNYLSTEITQHKYSKCHFIAYTFYKILILTALMYYIILYSYPHPKLSIPYQIHIVYGAWFGHSNCYRVFVKHITSGCIVLLINKFQ